MVEYAALVKRECSQCAHVACARQICVKAPDAEDFVNTVASPATLARIKPMNGKYVTLCNESGGVLNDPVLLRVAEDEFWFSLSDSDLEMWLTGVNVGLKRNVSIGEIDVAPVQIQGPKSEALMADIFGPGVHDVPFYGLMEGQVAGHEVVVSQTGFTGEKGYEIYLQGSEPPGRGQCWDAVLEADRAHDLMVASPGTARCWSIAGGILCWCQDMDQETQVLSQCNLGQQVAAHETRRGYIGRETLERARAAIERRQSAGPGRAGRHHLRLRSGIRLRSTISGGLTAAARVADAGGYVTVALGQEPEGGRYGELLPFPTCPENAGRSAVAARAVHLPQQYARRSARTASRRST